MSRGIKQKRDIFVTQMQSQYFPWTRVNKETGKEETTFIQGALRPVELWEYVFPEESLPQVLAMLNMQNLPSANYIPDTKIAMIRRMLKCGKIPKIPTAERQHIVTDEGMSLAGIGIKKDKRGVFDDKQFGFEYEQELL